MELLDRPCPYCNSVEVSTVLPANLDLDVLNTYAFASRKLPEYMHFEYGVCVTCDLMYARKTPPPTFFFEEYASADFDAQTESQFAAETYFEFTKNYVQPSSRILDIGAGDGAYMEVLYNNGYPNVFGVEPSEVPYNLAPAHIKDRIENKIFEDCQYTPRSFDFVTLFQTIEHLFSPLDLVSQVYDLLDTDGHFAIACHNYRSIQSKILGKRSPTIDVEHLQLNSVASARYLLEKAGFEDVNIFQYKNTYPLNYWIKISPLPNKLKRQLMQNGDRFKQSISVRGGNIAVVGKKRK